MGIYLQTYVNVVNKTTSWLFINSNNKINKVMIFFMLTKTN